MSMFITIDINGALLLERIQVQRIEDFKGNNATHKYVIRRLAEGTYRETGIIISHKYSDGGLILSKKVIDKLTETD